MPWAPTSLPTQVQHLDDLNLAAKGVADLESILFLCDSIVWILFGLDMFGFYFVSGNRGPKTAEGAATASWRVPEFAILRIVWTLADSRTSTVTYASNA